jgi:hypothetical protein
MYEARNPLLLDYQTKYLHIAVTGHGMHFEIHNFFLCADMVHGVKSSAHSYIADLSYMNYTYMLRLHTNLSTIAVDCCYAIHDKLTASRPCLSLSKILAILIYTIPYILMSLAYFRSGDDSKWISSYLFSLRCTPSSQCQLQSLSWCCL